MTEGHISRKEQERIRAARREAEISAAEATLQRISALTAKERERGSFRIRKKDGRKIFRPHEEYRSPEGRYNAYGIFSYELQGALASLLISGKVSGAERMALNGAVVMTRYRFEIRLTNTAELPADVSPEDMLLIKAPLFSKLRDLGTLDSCWESAEGDAFRLRVGESCGFRIPPHGISQSDLGAIEISVDSPRYEGTRTILIGENALERETVAIRAFPPQQRRIGKDSEIRFIIDPERSEYASAWIARNGANLLSIEASENLTENCSGGLNFDTIGNAGCIVGSGISSGEAETLIVRIGSVALPDQLDIRIRACSFFIFRRNSAR